ncbi:MAG: PhoX family phosphatase [Planctomycetota bacterium]|nr:PhoX family phosphatase [Planctomycetota bacterium]
MPLPREFQPDESERTNPSDATPLEEMVQARISRRRLMKGLLLPPFVAAFGEFFAAREAAAAGTSLTFAELDSRVEDGHRVAKGYRAEVLIRWGDAVLPGAPAFNPRAQTPEAQLKQFGYNNDFIAFLPLPKGSQNSDHGLLCVNHEYGSPELMFPREPADEPRPSPEERIEIREREKKKVDVLMAAHGHSVLEVKREGGAWKVVADSPYNRRISLTETQCRISGPAAGHARMKTTEDPTGALVRGTMNNCAGGVTPWGTVVICEENFDFYFGGKPRPVDALSLERYSIKGKPKWDLGEYYDRFDVSREPGEPNRFGWAVEYDPYDPKSVPVKRTALGRYKHEGAAMLVNKKDGRVVLFGGDDQAFEYIYRFVSKNPFDPKNPEKNKDLLDEGTLCVARFDDDGTLHWLPLVFGEGRLTPSFGFDSQADVVIDARRAADLVGATPMDRPEDVEANPVTGKVYASLTNNTSRDIDRLDKANPRFDNRYGHLLEFTPPGEGDQQDHAADTFTWDVFILAGNPNKKRDHAKYGGEVTKHGWFACPDNMTFDNLGRIWIATDQGRNIHETRICDGLWACDTVGPGRAQPKHFFTAPIGAEMCGPCMTPDNKTLFLSVQHPGEDKGSTFDDPLTRWPDFKKDTPPRPSVVVVTKEDGGAIGT